MKAKLLTVSILAAFSLGVPGAFAKRHVKQENVGRAAVVTTTGTRPAYRYVGQRNYGSRYYGSRYYGGGYGYGSGVSIGLGFGAPFGGYYPGYGYGYPYGSYYPYGYNSYYGGTYYSPGYYNRGYGYNSYGYNSSIVVQVQRRLAREGYYAGAIDGVAGTRTRYAIRAYERRHGLPADGVIDRRLLATMGLA